MRFLHYLFLESRHRNCNLEVIKLRDIRLNVNITDYLGFTILKELYSLCLSQFSDKFQPCSHICMFSKVF